MAENSKPTYEQLEQQVAELKRSTSQRHRARDIWRGIGIAALITAASAFFAIGTTAVWTSRMVNNTDYYVKAVGPLVQQPEVQTALVKRTSDAIFSNVDINQLVSQALPANASFLAAPIASQVKSQTNSVLTSIVSSQQFYNVWIDANRNIHARVLKIINNPKIGDTINVQQVYSALSQRLSGTSLGFLAGKTLPANIGQIQVAQLHNLQRVRQAVDHLKWVLLGSLILFVVCAFFAVWVAKNRRRMGIILSAALLLTTGIMWVSVLIVKNQATTNIADSTYKAAAQAAASTVMAPFMAQLLVSAVVAGLTILILWLTGRTAAARWVQKILNRAAVALHNPVFGKVEEYPLPVFFRQNRRILEWVSLAITIVVLAILAPLTAKAVLLATLILALVCGIIEVIGVPQKSRPRAKA